MACAKAPNSCKNNAYVDDYGGTDARRKIDNIRVSFTLLGTVGDEMAVVRSGAQKDVLAPQPFELLSDSVRQIEWTLFDD